MKIELNEIDQLIIIIDVPASKGDLTASVLAASGAHYRPQGCCSGRTRNNPFTDILEEIGIDSIRGLRTLAAGGSLPSELFSHFKEDLLFYLSREGYENGVAVVRSRYALFFYAQIKAIFPTALWIFPTVSDATLAMRRPPVLGRVDSVPGEVAAFREVAAEHIQNQGIFYVLNDELYVQNFDSVQPVIKAAKLQWNRAKVNRIFGAPTRHSRPNNKE